MADSFFYVNAARVIKTGCFFICLHFFFILGNFFLFFGNAWVALFFFIYSFATVVVCKDILQEGEEDVIFFSFSVRAFVERYHLERILRGLTSCLCDDILCIEITTFLYGPGLAAPAGLGFLLTYVCRRVRRVRRAR
jgi:hypothetical protein